MEEHKIGETFQYQNVVLEVVECKNHLCDDCYFYDGELCVVRKKDKSLEPCTAIAREDKTNIRFKQVNKVDMNKNLDLIKILDGCPAGTKFYSILYGEVRFAKIANGIVYFTHAGDCDFSVCHNGLYVYNYQGECVIFPSKDQRDWSKFERFWDKPKKDRFDPKTLKPFDRVLVRDSDEHYWHADLFSNFCDENEYRFCCCSSAYKYCIPYNSETQRLLGTKEEEPEYYMY